MSQENKPTIENPIDELLPVIAQAMHKWKAENTPEFMSNRIRTELNKHSSEILMKLLGFDKDAWRGDWRLDHCNGRQGNSAAGDFIREQQAQIIKDWLSTVAMPKLSEKELKQVQKSVDATYKYAFEQAARELAVSRAKTDAAAVINELTRPKQVQQYLQMLALIDQPQQNTGT